MNYPSPESTQPREALTSPHDILNRFIANTLASMSEEERASLTSKDYVDQFIAKVLQDIDGDDAAPARDNVVELIRGLYTHSPEAPFVQSPIDGGILMLGPDQELVSLQGAEVSRVRKGVVGEGTAFIERYDFAKPLTGPLKGQALPIETYPIPPPIEMAA
jgi:hypothetical protein